MKNWKTTLTGVSAALYTVLEPYFSRGEVPDKKVTIFAIVLALLGYFSADSKTESKNGH